MLMRNCPNPNNNPNCKLSITYKDKDKYKTGVNANSVCSSCCKIKNGFNYRLDNLLNNDLIAYYWIGFLLADAHFSTGGKFCIVQSEKDYNHIKQFAEFIEFKYKIRKCISKLTYKGIEKEYTHFKIEINHRDNVLKIMEKFDIHNRKTYDPPSLNLFENLSHEQCISIIIGFIDGDGWISSKSYNKIEAELGIQIHCSWQHILSYFNKKISNESGRIGRISFGNNKTTLIISNTDDIRALKKFANDHTLPILERKWSKVNLEYKNKNHKALEKKLKVNNLYDTLDTVTADTISSTLGITKQYAKKFLRKEQH